MKQKEEFITEEKVINTPAGGVLIGKKKEGQTIIHNDGSLGGFLIGRLHKDGGIKAINKGTGQPLEMQSNEVVITAPAVADTTKREFEGKMMTNREILSKINSDGGGVSFADGGDVPAKICTTNKEYEYGGKMVHDSDIAHSLGMNSTLNKGKQQFYSGGMTYDVDAIYNAIKKGKIAYKTKDVAPFAMKYPVYDKKYSETVKTDLRKPNGIMIRLEDGKEVLIDGNHRMNNAYLKGRKNFKVYYINDSREVARFAKKNKFELGGENKVGGHLSSGKSLKQIAEMHNVSLAHVNEELAKGLEVEKEHFADFKERTRVAKDHLVENPNYYTILAKAGLKMGGHIQRQELVEKSKKGDTPARDLNNYNDVMDLQADEAVGGDSGLAFADGGIFKSNSQDKIVKGVEVTNYNSGGLKEIAYNPNELLNIFKNFHKKIGFIDTHFFVTPFNNSDNKFKAIGVPIGGGDFQQIIPENMSEHKLLKYLKGKYGGLDWSNFTEQSSNYAKGGVVYDTTKPKIEKVTIKETRFNRASVVGRNASTVSELQKIVSDYIGTSPKEDYDWIKFTINDNTYYGYYIDLNKGKKNTVKNVNPETLNSMNFKRVIDAKTTLVRNYDWTDFFEGATNKTVRKGKIVDGVNVVYFDTDGKSKIFQYVGNSIQLYNFLRKLYNDGGRYAELQPSGNGIVEYPKSIDINSRAWQNALFVEPEKQAIESIMNTLAFALFPKLDFSKFNNRYTPTASTSANKPFDLTNTKIWIDDNPELSKAIQEKAFELGWEWLSGKEVRATFRKALFFNNDKIIIGDNLSDTKIRFNERNTEFSEIFPSDLGIDVNNLGTSASQTPTSTSGKEKIRFLALTSDSGGYKNVSNLTEVKDTIETIFSANRGKDESIVLFANGLNGSSFTINFGDNRTCETCYDTLTDGKQRIKDVILFYSEADKYDWSDFFEEAQTPTSNSVVPKIVEQGVYNLDLAINKLEKASSFVVSQYNKDIYDKSLKFLYDTKATYELALKFTPESAFMYERLDIMKKLADIEKQIKNIEDMKKGGTFYMLAKILEKLERGENWRQSETADDVITNAIPQSEIDIIIRSKKFKNWFGDWEKALINDEYDNVSKALTNRIPSVYHHGARRIKYTYREVSNGVLYLAENVSYAIWFSQNATAQTEEGNYLTECFVNIKNPIDLTAFNVNEIDFGDLIKYIDAIYPMAKIYNFVGSEVASLVKANQPTNIRMRAWQLIRSYAKFVNHIKENTPYDGFLYYENNPSDQVINPATGQSEENVTKAVAIFKSHQVKVVDAVLFDGGLDDWRFENGGKIKN